MKAIVRRSAAVVTFVGLLGLTLTGPQLRHVERLADLLVVAPRRKTLAQLAALERDGVDPSNLADFFRISPWDPDDLRLPLLALILRYLKTHNPGPGLPPYLTVDDSLAPKDKGTRKLQSVDWHFDHNQGRTVRGGSHVVLRIHWGKDHFPLLWRLYLRAATVRRRNRRRKHKLVYLYWRSYEARDAAGHTPSLSEVMTGIRQDHQREVLRAACAEVAAGTSVEAVLERYLGRASPRAA
jgi:hypothetical protein